MLKYQILRDYDNAIIHLKNKLGVKATSNLQLDTVGRHLFGRKYLGTYSADDYPKPDQMSDGDVFILNNKTHRSLGEHWLAVGKKAGHCYAFDTFHRSLGGLSTHFTHNGWIPAGKFKEQSDKETDCGVLSMAWLILFKKYGLSILHVI